MPQVGGGAALEEDEIEDAALLTAPENDEDDAQPAELGDEEGEAEIEAEPELTDEQRARTMGWHPLVEYRGDPRRWVPAAEFIRRAETEVPIMRDQNRRLQERVAKLDGVVAGLQVTAQEQLTAIKEMRELARKSDQRGYDRAIAELKEQRREAVEAGDTAAFDQIEARIGEAEKERAATAPKETTPAAPVVDPDIAAFTSRRDVAPWWNKDEQLTRAMVDHHSIIKGMHPAMSLSDQLELAFRRVKADFPAQFGAEEEPDPMADPPNPTPRPAARPATVARPSPPGAPALRTRSRWEQIADPAERAQAKAAFARQQRQMPDYTEDEYLDIYLEPHADALAVQSKRRAK